MTSTVMDIDVNLFTEKKARVAREELARASAVMHLSDAYGERGTWGHGISMCCVIETPEVYITIFVGNGGSVVYELEG